MSLSRRNPRTDGVVPRVEVLLPPDRLRRLRAWLWNPCPGKGEGGFREKYISFGAQTRFVEKMT